MARPALAAQQGDPGPQLPVLVEVDAVLLVEGDVDHAVVGGDVERGARRELLGEALDQPVDVHQLAPPGVGVDAEAMPGAVHLGVVRVDQGAVPGGQLRGRQIHPLLPAQPPVEGAAAERHLGQRGVLEGRRGHLRGVHARVMGALEDGGVPVSYTQRDRRSWFISSPVSGLRTVYPGSPCAPGGSPVPTEAREVAVVAG